MAVQNWLRFRIEKGLTRTRFQRKGKTKKIEKIEIPPSQRIVFAVEFCITASFLLTILEIVHIIVLRSFNESIFAAVMGFIGNVAGILLGYRE